MAAVIFHLIVNVLDKIFSACGYVAGPDYRIRPEGVEGAVIPDQQPRARIGYRTIALVAIIIFGLCFLFYLLIGIVILKSSYLVVNNVNAQYKHLNFNITNTTLSIYHLKGNFPPKLHLGKKGIAKVYPDMATYTLSTSVNDKHDLTAVSRTKYQILEYDQLIVVKFQSGLTTFQEEELRKFQKRLDGEATWIVVKMDFKMHVQLARFLVIPRNVNHVVCKFLYKGPGDEIHDESGCSLKP